LGGDSKARETVALLPQVEADDFALLTGLLAPLQFIIGGFCAAFSAGIKLGIAKEIKLKNPNLLEHLRGTSDQACFRCARFFLENPSRTKCTGCVNLNAAHRA
jgi:hypothetical protein